MGLLLTLITGLVIWVVLWATGAKSLDAILITLLLVVVAAAARMLAPHLPGRRSGDEGL
jgi:Mn2+/Fe2+ NRAMP family transporter